MKFRDVPVGAIVIVGNTLDGPFYARKLDGMVHSGQVMHNANWVTSDGAFQGVCILMEDQEVEIFSTDNADLDAASNAKPKRGTSKRTRGGSPNSGVPAASSDYGGEGVG